MQINLYTYKMIILIRCFSSMIDSAFVEMINKFASNKVKVINCDELVRNTLKMTNNKSVDEINTEYFNENIYNKRDKYSFILYGELYSIFKFVYEFVDYKLFIKAKSLDLMRSDNLLFFEQVMVNKRRIKDFINESSNDDISSQLFAKFNITTVLDYSNLRMYSEYIDNISDKYKNDGFKLITMKRLSNELKKILS